MAAGVFLDLSARAKWRLTGADRVRFLNGQVTNDVRRIPPGGVLPACVTTARGKLSGLIHISALSDALWFDAEAELREPLTARIERYIVADDAVLEDVTNSQCLFHIPACDSAPSMPENAAIRRSLRLTGLGSAGFDIAAPAAAREGILAALAKAGLAPAGDDAAEAMRIEAGVPRWGAELDEDTLPPEAGLDRVAVDYQKGCYIGQEVISRIKSVGHVNRILTGFSSELELAAGAEISTADGKPAGRITSAAWSFRLARWVALGYLKRGISTGAPLLAATPRGAVPIEIRDHPPAVP